MSIARIIALLVLLLSFIRPCMAGVMDDAFSAFEMGNYRKALQLFRVLADKGDPIAQSSLGLMYALGQGVPQDYSKAAKWYEKAALQGDPVAQSNLGTIYALGQGLPQDYVIAYMLFNVAAAQGEKIAAYNRDVIAREMTPAQIQEGQRLARESLPPSPGLASENNGVSPYSLARIPNSSSFARNFNVDPLQAAIEEANRKYVTAPQLQLETMVDERRDALNAKEPGRYVTIPADQVEQWQREWRAKHPAHNPAANHIDVPLKLRGGTFVVPVELNGAIKLEFTVDSGASDVAVPLDVFSTLKRAGTIKDSDLLGTQTYVLANGSKSKSARFTIRSLKVGDLVLHDVAASVSPLQGIPLLGQSFLKRLKSWSIDNGGHELHLVPR